MVNDRCPVMQEEPASPQHEVQFRGHAVRFCCEKCQDKFADDPLPYLSHLPQLPAATIQAAVADLQKDSRARQRALMVERWTRPVLLTFASLIGAFLVLRIAHRIRLAHATSANSEALDADEDLRGAHGPGGE